MTHQYITHSVLQKAVMLALGLGLSVRIRTLEALGLGLKDQVLGPGLGLVIKSLPLSLKLTYWLILLSLRNTYYTFICSKTAATSKQNRLPYPLFDRILCTTATSAPVERILYVIIMRPHSLQLKWPDSLLETLVFIKCNKWFNLLLLTIEESHEFLFYSKQLTLAP